MTSKAPKTKLLLIGETLVGLGRERPSSWLLRIFRIWEEVGPAFWERGGTCTSPRWTLKVICCAVCLLAGGNIWQQL